MKLLESAAARGIRYLEELPRRAVRADPLAVARLREATRADLPPRGEDPEAIIADILEGARAARRDLTVNPDRRGAIGAAIAAARRGDIVLVAGKGHERYQEIRGARHPFSDVTVAREALRNL